MDTTINASANIYIGAHVHTLGTHTQFLFCAGTFGSFYALPPGAFIPAITFFLSLFRFLALSIILPHFILFLFLG